MSDPVLLSVIEASQVGEARRTVARLVAALGFDETQAGRATIVVTEVANNLVKHGRDGVLLLRALECGSVCGVEILALDRGPGMAEVGKCLRDGFSTAGTPGTGLGAIVRLSAFTDIYSRPAQGTALLARLWAGPLSPSAPPRLQVGAVSVPRGDEEVCGDTWAVERQGGRALLLVADGLGHGPFAADAARAAADILRANLDLGPAAILEVAHQALRGTRGAAVAVAEVDLEGRSLRYAGVGNISGVVLVPGADRSLLSHNGIVGHEARKFQEFTYPFPRGALLVMHSDGLGSRWDLDPYPGLSCHDPALVAGVLYRDHQRGRDDVTVLAARAAEEQA
jgi:anti-sigma regulatory factor (Ser/Thr protein kinase)